MKKKLLISKQDKYREVKEVAIYEEPKELKLLLNELTWSILKMLCQREMYPMEIARELGIHEQKVYYHIRKLARANAIVKVREEVKKGATAKYYRPRFPAFGIELPWGETRHRRASRSIVDARIEQFLAPFLGVGAFSGKIVVGSPDPHGPFKTIARDGHYAAYLTFFLGQFAELPDDFVIKLDVDIKNEKEEKSNLVLVGGPGTNLLTQEVNAYLPTRFDMTRSKRGFIFGGLMSQKTRKVYTADSMGLVAKMVNPWDNKSRILVFAGNKAVGTKACVLALTKFSKELLKRYHGEDNFATVIQGFDMDGDGKVDSIEILE